MHHVNFDVDTSWCHVCIKISKTPYKYVSTNMLYKSIFFNITYFGGDSLSISYIII
jgi:hypothetical protein